MCNQCGCRNPWMGIGPDPRGPQRPNRAIPGTMPVVSHKYDGMINRILEPNAMSAQPANIVHSMVGKPFNLIGTITGRLPRDPEPQELPKYGVNDVDTLLAESQELFDTATEHLAFLNNFVGPPNIREFLASIEDQDLTCFQCPDRSSCVFVDDLYNTNGDCLANQ